MKPSQGAREIAEKLGVDLCAQDEVAALIDEELRELIDAVTSFGQEVSALVSASRINAAQLKSEMPEAALKAVTYARIGQLEDTLRGLAALLEKYRPKEEKS